MATVTQTIPPFQTIAEQFDDLKKCFRWVAFQLDKDREKDIPPSSKNN